MKIVPLLATLPVIGLLSISCSPAQAAEFKCSSSVGFYMAPQPCAKRYAVNYDACRKWLIDHGENSGAAFWYCTSQGYTK